MSLFAASALIQVAAAFTPPSYSVTDISTSPTSGLARDHEDIVHPSIGWAINSRGDVAGEAFVPGGGGYGFFFQHGNVMVLSCPAPARIPTLQARGVNNPGQVVGYFANADKQSAFLWEKGMLRDLGSLRTDGKPGFAIAHGVNDVGWVVGEAATSGEGRPQAFLWRQGRMTALGRLPGGKALASAARGVNAKGDVVGSSTTASEGVTRNRAFKWRENEGMRPLSTLSGPNSQANAVSDAGQVVGWAEHRSTNGQAEGPMQSHAVLWDGERIKDLGTLGGQQSEAAAVNNKGQIVGWSTSVVTAPLRGIPAERAFLWRDGRMHDLNDLIPAGSGWRLHKAHGINDRGQIVGEGTRGLGAFRAFLLTPK